MESDLIAKIVRLGFDGGRVTSLADASPAQISAMLATMLGRFDPAWAWDHRAEDAASNTRRIMRYLQLLELGHLARKPRDLDPAHGRPQRLLEAVMERLEARHGAALYARARTLASARPSTAAATTATTTTTAAAAPAKAAPSPRRPSGVRPQHVPKAAPIKATRPFPQPRPAEQATVPPASADELSFFMPKRSLAHSPTRSNAPVVSQASTPPPPPFSPVSSSSVAAIATAQSPWQSVHSVEPRAQEPIVDRRLSYVIASRPGVSRPDALPMIPVVQPPASDVISTPEARTMVPEALEARTMAPEARKMSASALEASALEARTISASTPEARTISASTPEARTMSISAPGHESSSVPAINNTEDGVDARAAVSSFDTAPFRPARRLQRTPSRAVDAAPAPAQPVAHSITPLAIDTRPEQMVAFRVAVVEEERVTQRVARAEETRPASPPREEIRSSAAAAPMADSVSAHAQQLAMLCKCKQIKVCRVDVGVGA
jgi:hypothetical protein